PGDGFEPVAEDLYADTRIRNQVEIPLGMRIGAFIGSDQHDPRAVPGEVERSDAGLAGLAADGGQQQILGAVRIVLIPLFAVGPEIPRDVILGSNAIAV